MAEPELSIVVAAAHARQLVVECLKSIESQIGWRSIEVLVVTNSADDARIVRERFPAFTLVETPDARLVQNLWGAGVMRARGRIFALTAATCVPDAQWVEETLKAHTEYHSAIGGAVELAPNAGLLDSAMYFVRYTPCMLPFDEEHTAVPSENGSYKRAAIADQMNWIAANGFWEQNVNEHLRSQMRSLKANPRSIVYVKQSHTFGGFMRHQFVHGRLLGQARATRHAGIKRLLYLAASPAIPLIRLSRIIRPLLAKKRRVAPFFLSLPLIVWFLICGAIGEVAGMARLDA